MAFDGREDAKTQTKEHHAEPEMMFIVSISHGKQDFKVERERKMEHFSNYARKILIFFLSGLITIQLFNEKFWGVWNAK